MLFFLFFFFFFSLPFLGSFLISHGSEAKEDVTGFTVSTEPDMKRLNSAHKSHHLPRRHRTRL